MALFRPRGRGGEDAPLSSEALSRVLALVQRVASEDHAEDTLEAALDAAIDLTDAERGWILIQRHGGGLEAAAARRRGGGELEEPLSKISRTVVERALSENRPLIVDEAREDQALAQARSVAEMRLRAVLCVPFRLQDDRGVFYLDNRFASGIFNALSLHMLAAFAGPVAMLLRHSELERQLAETAAALRHANHALDERLRAATVEVARLESLASHVPGSGRDDPFPEILGTSPPLRRALDALALAAAGDFPVLLRGESGTGKDLAARALHRASPRRGQPFVAVPAAGLSADLLEAELFGVRRGAFTGAEQDRDGLFASAGAGSLYLDGLDALAAPLQPKLLRVLEDGSFRPVGGGPQQHSRARVIAATRRDLAECVSAGTFREDLYYRVRVLEIVLPPLRERRSDIPLLLEHFLAAEAARTGSTVAPPGATERERLMAYAWPGNVRELANFATRWVAYGGRLPAAEWERLLDDSGAGVEEPTLREISDRHLLRVLEEAGGNKAEAARRLGVSRRTLYNRLRGIGA
ncbi:MAG: GAF domain-containing protein [Planctomycetota bacterium]|nr:MAG: GAF domain-containing protein [Planctomycetota bacterium]